MNEPTNSQSNDPGEKTAGEKINTAANRGAEDAKRLASEFIPAVKKAARKLSYGVAFGTTYGGSFAATLIKEMTPKSVKEGCSEGIAAGRKSAENLLKPSDTENQVTSIESTGYVVT